MQVFQQKRVIMLKKIVILHDFDLKFKQVFFTHISLFLQIIIALKTLSCCNINGALFSVIKNKNFPFASKIAFARNKFQDLFSENQERK